MKENVQQILHRNPVGKKVLNDICKVVKQWVTEIWEVEKTSKMEDISNSNSSLSSSKNLAIEIPDRFYKLTKTKNSNAFLKLRELKLKNPKNIVISHPDIKPKRNKFASFKELISSNIDICLHSWTKIEEAFQKLKLKLKNTKFSLRAGINNGLSFMFHINKNIPSKN